MYSIITGLCFTLLFPTNLCQKLEHSYYEKKEGQIYHHGGNGLGLISRVLASSKMQCLQSCTKEPHCFNVNFKEGEVCELFGLADGGWYESKNTFDSYFVKSGSAPRVVVTTTTPPPTTTVPDCTSLGLIDLGVHGSCYYIDAISRNALNGNNACKSQLTSMSLVSFETRDEFNTVKAYADSTFPSKKWNIGLNDTLIDGQYVWISTGAMPSWTNWSEGRPIGENCVILLADGKWYDVECSTTLSFYVVPTICEYNY